MSLSLPEPGDRVRMTATHAPGPGSAAGGHHRHSHRGTRRHRPGHREVGLTPILDPAGHRPLRGHRPTRTMTASASHPRECGGGHLFVVNAVRSSSPSLPQPAARGAIYRLGCQPEVPPSHPCVALHPPRPRPRRRPPDLGPSTRRRRLAPVDPGNNGAEVTIRDRTVRRYSLRRWDGPSNLTASK